MTAALFHYPMACSTACRIAAAEGGLSLALEQVDIYSKELASGGSYFDIAPLGQLAAVRMANGELLTGTAAVLLWIQSNAPDEAFRLTPDDDGYFQLAGWLTYCATELHKQLLWPLLRATTPPEMKAFCLATAPEKFAYLDWHLSRSAFLTGGRFTAADAYLAWILALAPAAGLDASGHTSLEAYQAAVFPRPAIAAILDEDRKAAIADAKANGRRAFRTNPLFTAPAATPDGALRERRPAP